MSGVCWKLVEVDWEDLNSRDSEDITRIPNFYIACEETITGAIKPTNMTEEDLKAIPQTIFGVKV